MTYSRYKRAASFLLALVMIFTLLPEITPGASADASGSSGTLDLGNNNLGLSYTTGTDGTALATNNIIVSWTGTPPSTINGTATGFRTGNTSLTDRNSYSTLTMKNNYTVNAKLSFDYSLTATNGTLKIDGTVSTSGSYEKTLGVGETTTIYIESSNGKNKTVSVSLTNIQLVPEKTVSVAFQPAENGSYTVNGNAAPYTYSGNADGATFALAPTPASGYKFACWYDVTNQKYLSRDANANITIGDDCTVTAKFVKSDAAMFQVGTNASNSYYDLGDAISASDSSSSSDDKVITLATSGTIYGNYTIPKSITLLIPFDEAHTLYTDEPGCIDKSGVISGSTGTYETPSPFKTLTMASGSSITVNGAISVSAKHASPAIGEADPGGGAVSGKYGYIIMNSGSNIILNSGAQLYCWGYISGDGMVEALSGSTVYEHFQVRDFRGGTATGHLTGNGDSSAKGKAFVFSQYYVQNIEAALKVNAGAVETIQTAIWINGSKTAYDTNATFFGNSSKSGLFNISDGYVIKKYDPYTDRLNITVHGGITINSITVTVASLTSINSEDYVLPMTSNIGITLEKGSRATINNSLAFLPGTSLTVEEGASIEVEKEAYVYFYSRDNWVNKGFVYGSKDLIPVKYSPTKKYDRTSADLKDAELKINGSVTVPGNENGGIYTTTAGGPVNVWSDTSGASITFTNGGCQNGNTCQVTQSGTDVTLVSVGSVSVVLKNREGSQDATVATANAPEETTYYYDSDDGVWSTETPKKNVTIKFLKNDLGADEALNTEYITQATKTRTPTVLNKNTFVREDYTFTGWNNYADGNGKAYSDGATINTTDEGLRLDGEGTLITLYAQWERSKYNLTLEGDGNGTIRNTALKVDANATKTEVENSIKNSTDIFTPNTGYEFDKLVWTSEGDTVTADQSVTVTFKKKTFTVTVDKTPYPVEYGGSVEFSKVTELANGSYSVIMSVPDVVNGTVSRTANGYMISNVTDNITVTTNKINVNIWLYDKDAYAANPEGKKLVVLRQIGTTYADTAPTTGFAIGGSCFYWSGDETGGYKAYVMFANAKLDEKQLLNMLTVSDKVPTVVNYDGDITGDGRVTSVDAGIINDILHGRNSSAITDLMRLRMDVAGTESASAVQAGTWSIGVDTQDIRKILRLAVGTTA